MSRHGPAASVLSALIALTAAPLLADKDHHDEHKERHRGKKPTLNQQLVHDLMEGEIHLKGDHAAVDELILNRNIPISYDYVATLMRTPNAFGEGVACIVCHSSSDPARSYRGLDLSTCNGIKTGSTEAPARKLFEPGQDPKKTILGRRLRNNRMPFGVNFNVPNDSPSRRAVRDWIAAGAPNDDALPHQGAAALQRRQCLCTQMAGLHRLPHGQCGTAELPRAESEDLRRHHAWRRLGGQGRRQGHQDRDPRQTRGQPALSAPGGGSHASRDLARPPIATIPTPASCCAGSSKGPTASEARPAPVLAALIAGGLMRSGAARTARRSPSTPGHLPPVADRRHGAGTLGLDGDHSPSRARVPWASGRPQDREANSRLWGSPGSSPMGCPAGRPSVPALLAGSSSAAATRGWVPGTSPRAHRAGATPRGCRSGFPLPMVSESIAATATRSSPWT